MNRHLIEFDVRVAPERIRADPEDHKYLAEFLLRPDAGWPMSVDGLIWPSVFVLAEQLHDPRNVYGTVAIDEVREEASPWLDLAKMRAWYEAHRPPGPRDVCIAVELLTERPLEGTAILYEMSGGLLCGLSVEPVVPARPPVGSLLLGFDVADASGISGLMNCGYTPEELASWRPTWGPRLNERGLLSTLGDAVAFREAADRRVEEPRALLGVRLVAGSGVTSLTSTTVVCEMWSKVSPAKRRSARGSSAQSRRSRTSRCPR